MPSLTPTSLAVSDAITHYRQIRELTRDELAYVLQMAGHALSADAIAEMENRDRPVGVDDLVAIAYALGTTPAVLLTHIPIDMPAPEGPLATGLPGDVGQAEARAWIEGRTQLDHSSRSRWWLNEVGRLRVLVAYHDEQLQAVRAEISDLGELAVQEEDTPQVQVLHERVREGEHALSQSEIALALAERQLDELRAQLA
ncbi:hypothetical protein C8K30_1027 [Promicromonospora sp. AC04]|uniref:helix-turn-helix domain-containing protein n=1 Tax=Promicromonospora sp. AC04 TaxID=2135723 RepID=UPI000D333E4D|nr:helix-turn-helix transcriptional regulator [Promicromonospora sp. AC04]PUB29633.1 hypothetical protein C8K30_1027 [Promicromonospora sp. AC04]